MIIGYLWVFLAKCTINGLSEGLGATIYVFLIGLVVVLAATIVIAIASTPQKSAKVDNPKDAFVTIGDYKVTNQKMYEVLKSQYGINKAVEMIDEALLADVEVTAEQRQEIIDDIIYGENAEELDEFANMPPLKDVTTMITAARSRLMRFTMIIQNFAQLDDVYGKEEAETIRGNCGNIIYLITTELKALEEISKMCGEVKSKKDDKTASTPLVTVSDLQRMKQFEVIILRMRKQPFKTKFTPHYKLDWGKEYPKAKYPSRKKEEVHTDLW